ncbi:hypothetical protein BDZ45DRAFT_728818 [Acephala macrosclerotiorum]|nr:hypothetical protein BDZ45DRAFT_728818 [Acephala macrosclerotiorum]
MAQNDKDATEASGRPLSQQVSETDGTHPCSRQARSNISPSIEAFRSSSRPRSHTTPHESIIDRKTHSKSLSHNVGHDDSCEYIFDSQQVQHSQRPRYSPGLEEYLGPTEIPESGRTDRTDDGTSSSSSLTGQPHTPESSHSVDSFAGQVLNPRTQDRRAPKHTITNASAMKSDPDSTVSCNQKAEARQQYQQEDEDENNESDSDDSSAVDESDDEELVPQSESYEALVIQAVGGNFDLAARLIPQLHNLWYQERSAVLGAWQPSSTQRGSSAGNGHVGSSTMHIFAAGNSGSKKGGNKASNEQQDNQDHGQDEHEEDSDDDDEIGRPKKKAGSISHEKQLLACHFHKRYPERYNAFHTSENCGKFQYRTCAGPGFTTVRRLRAHFKQTHLHVQCGRCSQLFQGTPSKRVADLNAHQLQGCSEKLPLVNEGVTLLHWAQIEDKTSGKKGGGKGVDTSEVQKWNEIWGILFPGQQLPSPWFDSTPAADFSLSSLRLQTSEYEKCYDAALVVHIAEVGPSHVNHKHVAAEAFQSWHTKVLAERKLTQLPIRNVVAPSNHTNTTDYCNDFNVPSTFTAMVPPLGQTRSVSFPQSSGLKPIYSSQQDQKMMPSDENCHCRSNSAPEIAPVHPKFQCNVQGAMYFPDPMFPDLAFGLQDPLPDSSTLAGFMTTANLNVSNPGQHPQHMAQTHPMSFETLTYDNGQPHYPPVESSLTDIDAYPSNSMASMSHTPSVYDPNTIFAQQQHNHLQKNYPHNGSQTWPKFKGTSQYVNGQNQFQSNTVPFHREGGVPGNMNWDESSGPGL